MSRELLAINGGPKVRETPLPYRKLFGEEELKIVTQVFENSWHEEVDFGFQGKYEQLYTDRFCEFQGGGFADAVSSGTIAVYLALQALAIAPGSDVMVSPVTDPGSVAPVIHCGFKPVVADAHPGSFNVGPAEFEAAITPSTKAAILTHSGGHPIDIGPILDIANAHGIQIIEDCSQAHGALYQGKRVGRFGALAAFATGFSKNHASGGCGGLVFTEQEEYYRRIRWAADRGKPFEDADYDSRNPSTFLMPALNFNQDELSCAIGYSTLSRLQETIDLRQNIADKIDAALEASSVVSPIAGRPDDCVPSLFFHTLQVDTSNLTVSKEEFAQAVAAEGIWINPNYKYTVSQWNWIQEHLTNGSKTPNAIEFRDSTFNLLFNEKFTDEDINDVITSILKVESVLAKNTRATYDFSPGADH